MCMQADWLHANRPPGHRYPERVIWHALMANNRDGDSRRARYGVDHFAGGAQLDLRLLGASTAEPSRDALAKLRRDYPRCFSTR